MAHSLYFNDGTAEVMFDRSPETFARILRERLGNDAERLFRDIIDQTDELNEANDTNSALEDELEEIRGERDELEESKRQVAAAAESMQEAADGAHDLLTDLSQDIFYGRISTMQEITERLSEIEQKISDIRDTAISY